MNMKAIHVNFVMMHNRIFYQYSWKQKILQCDSGTTFIDILLNYAKVQILN